MRTGITALVFLLFLLGGHLFFTLMIFPAFDAYDTALMQEHASEFSRLDDRTQRELSSELNRGRLNGSRGVSLGIANLAADGISLLVVTCLLVTTYRRARKEHRLKHN